MISLHFHWAWIVMAVLVILGIAYCIKQNKESDPYGIGAAIGCVVFVGTILLALILGGIFIW